MKVFSTIIISVLISCSAFSQLVVTDGTSLTLTPKDLLQYTLIKTDGYVSNCTLNGDSGIISTDAIGTFIATDTAMMELGFAEGILLTTGKASIAVGPNLSPSDGTSYWTGSDPDLAALCPGYDIYDAATFEFDFIPLNDTICFQYVFGSEEFPEYCYSAFNDVFGFFVSGPGISGPYTNSAINIALLPDMVSYVTIDNLCGSPYLIDNSGGQYIEYDKYSQVLTASLAVQPCQSYHMKIAIGDAGDNDFDSGIFLKAKSLDINGNYIAPGIENNPLDQLACINGMATFSVSSIYDSNFYYQWQFSDDNGSTWYDIDSSVQSPTYMGYLTNFLLVYNLSDTNNGYLYRCMIADTVCDNFIITQNAEISVSATSTYLFPAINLVDSNLTTDSAVAYQWYFNGNPIAGADSQTLVPVLAGNYQVEVWDTVNCTSISDQFYFNGLFSGPSVQEYGKTNDIRIYPCPAENKFTLEADYICKNTEIFIYDILGNVVQKEPVCDLQKKEINLFGHPAGVYFVRIQNDDFSKTFKIIKK